MSLRFITTATVCVLLATPAFAGDGAIAWDRASGKYGASWNQSTLQRAADAALKQCKGHTVLGFGGAKGCKVVMKVGPGICGAFATNENGKQAGAAMRKDRNAAQSAALANCQKNGAECTVKAAHCNN